jgi:hypothetical protein
MSIAGGPQGYVASSYNEIGSVVDLPQNRSEGSPQRSPSGEAGWFDPAPGHQMHDIPRHCAMPLRFGNAMLLVN